jgi:hypothetical protein
VLCFASSYPVIPNRVVRGPAEGSALAVIPRVLLPASSYAVILLALSPLAKGTAAFAGVLRDLLLRFDPCFTSVFRLDSAPEPRIQSNNAARTTSMRASWTVFSYDCIIASASPRCRYRVTPRVFFVPRQGIHHRTPETGQTCVLPICDPTVILQK